MFFGTLNLPTTKANTKTDKAATIFLFICHDYSKPRLNSP
jgi:hypothetical protein